MVRVVEAFVRVETQSPPGEDRHLHAEQPVDDVAQSPDLKLNPGEALHQGDIAERVGGVLGQV